MNALYYAWWGSLLVVCVGAGAKSLSGGEEEPWESVWRWTELVFWVTSLTHSMVRFSQSHSTGDAVWAGLDAFMLWRAWNDDENRKRRKRLRDALSRVVVREGASTRSSGARTPLPAVTGPWGGSRAAEFTRRVLERDNYECQLRLRGCTGKADTADHKVPKSRGGAWWDINNGQAACRHCNSSKGAGLDEGQPIDLPDWLK